MRKSISLMPGRKPTQSLSRPNFRERPEAQLPAVRPPAVAGLSLSRPPSKVSTGLTFPGLVRFATRRASVPVVGELPAQERFPMLIDFSQREVRLPFGVPRFVNAATLRAMAGDGRATRLLKMVGNTWEFVPDESLIDLDDRSVQFRLGRLTIYS